MVVCALLTVYGFVNVMELANVAKVSGTYVTDALFDVMDLNRHNHDDARRTPRLSWRSST